LVGLAPQLSALHKPWLGPYVGADHHLLFVGAPHVGATQGGGAQGGATHTGVAQASAAHLRSVALVPLPRKDRATGAVCWASVEPTRFTRHHATDFLAHLGVVAAVCLENAINRARLLRAGITDFLTGWHNRRYLQQRLKEELSRAQRRGSTIACLMMDIDRFKSINDGHGHLAGDAALREVAQRVEGQIRSMDTAARFGGDELSILLPETTQTEAAHMAERIREAIANEPFTLNAQVSLKLTISIGVAAVAPGRHEPELKVLADRLVAEADAALYRAKALGRNRVHWEGSVT
jgi:diguanylate cyclase (GGDEF)-like protein